MIGKTFVAALVLAGALVPSLASAQVAYRAVEESNLVSGKQRLDPAKAYIFVHFQTRFNGLFIKSPDAEELAAYEAKWRAELAEAIEDFPSDHARWIRDRAFNAKLSRPKQLGPEPVMPTEQSFRIPEIERGLMVGFGPMFTFSKAEDHFSYLIEVEPGTYSYYGPLFMAAQAPSGLCFCMGSVKFDAPAGRITNLGNFLALRWMNRQQAAAMTANFAGEALEETVDYTLPTSLSAFPSQPADFQAAGKVNNFYGVMIGRMPPVPGVLAYERDRVIDLKTVPE